MSVETELVTETMRRYGRIVDNALETCLSERSGCPTRLLDAMRYSVFAGGKRLRPVLTLMACDACAGPVDAAIPAACALEMVHTYSLIHDDLPAMDDDAMRRGRPTCHRQFDEATAILAGDALLTLAFETAAEIRPVTTAARCVKALAFAAGRSGMVGGQMDDLTGNANHNLEWLESLHARKTGALLTASLRLGGMVAGASTETLEILDRYGACIGLAFQIIDDLLDVEGDPAALGKEARKDAAAGKVTYPGLLGVEESRRRARKLVDEARSIVAPMGPRAAPLAALAGYIAERDR